MDKGRFKNEELLLQESLMSIGNGYVGMRGNFEEGYPKGYDSIRGTYINGLYEIYDIKYGENSHGFPQDAQKILNITDAQTIEIHIDGDLVNLFEGTIINLERTLNIYDGYYLRKIEWISPKGHRLYIEIKKMASFMQKELIIINYSITSLNYSGDIKIISKLDGDIKNHSDKSDMRVSNKAEKLLHIKDISSDDNYAYIYSITKRSNIGVCVYMAHDLGMNYSNKSKSIDGKSSIYIDSGSTISFTKYIVYTDTLRHKDPIRVGRKLIESVTALDKQYWFSSQIKILSEFWQYSYVKVTNTPSVEEALNYNVYQLLSSAGSDKFSNISAKGLTGEGYEGHYFWDTEIYMIPFFMITNSIKVKSLLKFRYYKLDKAKKRSLQMGHTKGAKIPWRTISGDECSSYFPAGSAQYHINADVAYSYIQYFLYTRDYKLMLDFGFEVIYETARIWLEVGHFKNNEFRIDSVTGPDEYTAIVNNNYFTNAMARYHLNWTVRLSKLLHKENAKRYVEIAKKIKITKRELNIMQDAANKMYLPFSEDMNINLQDDSFIDKADWDFENTLPEKYPLLLNYHPLTIYRYKVLKQADTLLAHFLLDEEDDEIITNCFNYYEKYTTHDSSLSACIHSIMAAKIGDIEKAYSYFMKTIRLDLDNINSNTKDGLHMANAGGAYMTIIYGFGGLRIKEKGLYLKPSKPKEWDSIHFSICYLKAQIDIMISDIVSISTDRPIDIYIYGNKHHVKELIQFNLLTRNLVN